MANINKPEKLTAEELKELTDFIGTSVLRNYTFPSQSVGVSSNTVQDMTRMSIPSLENYGDWVEKQNQSSGSSFKGRKGPKKFGNVLASDLVKFLLNLIKYKEYEEYLERLENKKITLQSKLDDLKTPEELRKELKEQLAELETA